MRKLVCLLLLAPAPALADESPPDRPLQCVPMCRDGFACLDGACVSACNPVCGSGETCTGIGPGICVRPIAPPTVPPTTVVVNPAPVAPPASPTPSRRTRFGLFLGGLAVPDDEVAALAGGITVSRSTGDVGWEPRLVATLYTVESIGQTTSGAALSFQGTYWFGAYGIGAGFGIGYAQLEGEVRTESAQVLSYLAPVMIRIGGSPQLELGMNVGTTRFVDRDDFEPWGYLYAGLHF